MTTLALTLKRRQDPDDPSDGALLYFSLIAAAGFAFGWAAQVLTGF